MDSNLVAVPVFFTKIKYLLAMTLNNASVIVFDQKIVLRFTKKIINSLGKILES